MAIVKVEQQLGVTTGTSLTTTFAATPGPGNLLIAVFRAATTASNITAPAGWTQAVVQDCTGGSVTIGIWYKVAGASESTAVTFTSSVSVSLSLHSFNYSGTATTSPFDKSASTDGGVSTITTISSGTTPTTTEADELCIAGVGLNTATGVFNNTWTNSFTRQTNASRLSCATRVVSATGTYETTETWDTARNAVAAIATFKAAAAVAGEAWGSIQI